MKGTIIVLAILIFLPLVSYAGEKTDDTVKGLYSVYMEIKPIGIPDDVNLAKLSPYLSPKLTTLLKSADDAEKKYKAATKGEAPPMVEGDIFTSLFEGANSYRVATCEEKGDEASCIVNFQYSGRGDGEDVRWKDTVYLVRSGGGWLVDDVGYGGDWDFAQKGRLTGLLKGVIEEGSAETAK